MTVKKSGQIKVKMLSFLGYALIKIIFKFNRFYAIVGPCMHSAQQYVTFIAIFYDDVYLCFSCSPNLSVHVIYFVLSDVAMQIGRFD